MSYDQQFQNINYSLSELEHSYGENIHILKDPYLLSLMAKIGSPLTTQPLLTEYVKKAYHQLFVIVSNHLLPKKVIASSTRMIESHPEGQYVGEQISDETKIVCVDLARAGIIPSQLFYQEYNYLLNPQNIRQDHFYAARKTNDKNEVIGVDISGSKIGGDIDNAFVILPDPMGATGGTICHAIDHYKNFVDGHAKKFIAVHLVVTPEYIKRIQKEHSDVEVFAIRLDRGFSSTRALNSLPGKFPDEEYGLNKHQYIVPGAGGLGELLNNSYV